MLRQGYTPARAHDLPGFVSIPALSPGLMGSRPVPFIPYGAAVEKNPPLPPVGVFELVPPREVKITNVGIRVVHFVVHFVHIHCANKTAANGGVIVG